MADQTTERILIVRHAQSAANAGGRTSDPAAIPITDTGVRQAQCVARLVSEKPSLIAVSRFLRTTQTAAPLLLRYPGVPVEQWRIEEFTYLDAAACAGTTYAERQVLRDRYWARCDPLWVDGPGCECFADFISRVRRFEQALTVRNPDGTVVVFTHGLVMRTLLWFRQHPAGPVTAADMAAFAAFHLGVSVLNCAVLGASPSGSGRLHLSGDASVAHIPADLRTN